MCLGPHSALDRLCIKACSLTSCSEQITNSVHLPSHFPILEGSGRGFEPRRLRGNDESPVRSRLPSRLSSHHSRDEQTCTRPPPPPPQPLPPALPLTVADPSPASAFVYTIPVAGMFSGGGKGRGDEKEGGAGGVRFTPACCCCEVRPTPNHLGHTFRRGGDTHKGTKRDGKLSQSAPGCRLK